MPRCNGSYLGHTPSPNSNVASGIWTVREAESYLRASQWPATPTVPSAPTGTAGNGQVALTWTAPTGGSSPTDYEVQYSSNGGSTWTTFSDGVSTATSATVTGLTNGTGYIFRVRAVNTLGEGPYGSASGTVTPAAIVASLLLHFDGANGSTTFTDSSSNGFTMTTFGTPQISTTQSKFGGASGYFDGGDLVLGPDSSQVAFGTGDFIVEAWIYVNDPAAYGAVFSSRNSGPTNEANSVFLALLGDGSPIIYTDGQDLTATTAVADNTWTHVAWTRKNGTARIYVDGVESGSVSFTKNLTGENITIGGEANTAQTKFTGYIDELRIAKGAGIDANFTPPSSPY